MFYPRRNGFPPLKKQYQRRPLSLADHIFLNRVKRQCARMHGRSAARCGL